jgi:hypothetical protein
LPLAYLHHLCKIWQRISRAFAKTLFKMDSNEKDNLIPSQRVGSRLDTSHEFKAETEHEAKMVFRMAADRLLNVNVWEKICGSMSAKFFLTDKSGNLVNRAAKAGDHFKIDIPGPGPSAGDGYDWVEVEAMDDHRNPSGPEESLTIRVRPSPSPANETTDTAHFFKDDATSSFRVRRVGRRVIAEVHGRNEVPNTNVKATPDKIRNAVVGSGAVAGMSKPQWKNLVAGLLDPSLDV